jgi:hypothetical protein
VLGERVSCLPVTGGSGQSAKVVKGRALVKRLTPGDYVSRTSRACWCLTDNVLLWLDATPHLFLG